MAKHEAWFATLPRLSAGERKVGQIVGSLRSAGLILTSAAADTRRSTTTLTGLRAKRGTNGLRYKAALPNVPINVAGEEQIALIGHAIEADAPASLA